jgi:prophage maintenance system killer protein
MDCKPVIFTNKYHLNRSQSIFLAKKKWDENIYCGMKMENRNVTFPQTQTILQGVNVGSVTLDDVQAILNMRDAWKYTLDTIEEELDLSMFCKMNEYISRNESLEWGVLRKGSVGISGTKYIPGVPKKEEAEKQLNRILKEDVSHTEKALNLFLWGARSQLFWDGNKRTSLLGANKILVGEGCGMLTINEMDINEFNTLLTSFYETGEGSALKKFLYEKAITGMQV